MKAHLALHLFTVVAVVAVAHFVLTPVQAQVRGVYPVGMSATNSGVTPEGGFSYSNLFVFFSRDEEKGPHGEIVATGQNSIMMDMNSFVWVSKKEISLLGGPGLGTKGVLALGTAQRNIAAALVVGGKDFDDPKVLVMIVVVAVVGLLILMPLARVLGTRSAETPV